MELTNHHRAALLEELKAAHAEAQSAKYAMESESAKADLSFAEAQEIREFLAKNKIAVIEQAIINNDIDY